VKLGPIASGVVRSAVVPAALTALGVLLPGCRQAAPPVEVPSGARPIELRLDHLRHLGFDVTVEGSPVRAVALYAEAPDYHPIGSPARDGFEGLAALDDAARAAIVYLRHFERTADQDSRREALALLAFAMAMEGGDGEFLNFIHADGTPNRTAPTSRKSFSYWAARALWAMGEAVRVLGPDDPDVGALRPTLERTIFRLAAEVARGRLVGGSATATAEALLGLLSVQQVDPTVELADLAGRTAELLVPLARGGTDSPPWGAHIDPAEGIWHAWGARAVQALALAGRVLDRPDLVVAAQREADQLWVRFVLAGEVPATVSVDGGTESFAQIAYGVSPVVEGYLALAAATGESRYGVLAGLTAGWFLGANRPGTAMYDTVTGRTFDGLRGPSADQLNRNSGAESTIEALLALGAVTTHPEAAVYLGYRSADPIGPSTSELSAAPTSREFNGPEGGSVIVSEQGATFTVDERAAESPVELTYWPAANPIEVDLARRLAADWNARHPDVQVHVQPIPAGRSSEEVLLAAVVGNATPDICSNVSSGLLARLVRAGAVHRLDELAATAARLDERANEPMIGSLRLPDGGIYAIPWKTNPMMLMYNVDQLAEAGVAPPRTYGDLIGALRRLVRDTDGDGRLDRWGFWARLKTTWFERFYDFYPLYLAASGGRTLVSRGEVMFENEAAVEAIEILQQAFAEELLPRSNFEGRDPFMDGTVAMKVVGPWFVKELEELKVPGLRYDVTPVPVPDGDDPAAAYAFADLKSIAVFSTTRHPVAAARFVAYLTSPEADRLLIEEAAQLPYRRALASDRRFAVALTSWPTLEAYAALADRSRDIDIDPDIVEIFDILSEAYEAAAIYGTMSPEQAIREAAGEVREVLRAR
jgi:multiple sugar transport system substrate-binding protein